jgi:hypothetical protein
LDLLSGGGYFRDPLLFLKGNDRYAEHIFLVNEFVGIGLTGSGFDSRVPHHLIEKDL